MLPVEQLQALIRGKKVAFIGAGVSHKQCIPQFVEMGAQVTLCDQKKSLEDFGDYADTLRRLDILLSLGEHYTDGFAGQDIIMRTPGYDYTKPELQAALAAGVMVTSEVELFFEYCPCEIIAVTGSDGKTTTTTLIAKMMEAAGRKVLLGGNIGYPLLPRLGDVRPEDVAVVELSSFQLISMRRSPKVAVVTNVTPNHLDHHKDMQEYIDAKRNILLWQNPPCRAVLGFENDVSRAMAADCKGEQVWFTRLHDTDNGAFLRADDMLCYAENGAVTEILPRKDVKLRGLHNVENLLAACAAVWGRAPLEAMRQVGSTFTGVEHRIEPVRTLDDVTYYNDSIATSPTRTIAGLRSFEQKIILIAGGYDKHIPYEPLAPELLAHVKTLVLMGATGPVIERALRGCPGFTEDAMTILHADSMKDAVEKARAAAQPGDVVSLSPASASFDCYPNFEVRGQEYKRLVMELASGMIAAVTTPAQKAAFLSAVQGRPCFHALLGRDLALWADNPGAPIRLFVLPGGALAISGRSAQLCGVPEDGEELAAFLRFAGVERVTCSDPMPGWTLRQKLFLYTLAPGEQLPVGKPPEGLLWREDPSVMEIARRLFPEDTARAEAFYSETCTALAHGYARVAALYDASGRQVSTVGAYAMTDGEAYMAMGETAAEQRGRGIGGWLIAEFANRLSAEGWQVSFLCEQKRCHFYDRLGFACTGRYDQYTISGMDND